MLTKKDKIIRNQETKIRSKDIFIRSLKRERAVLKQENKDLTDELDKAKELIDKIHKFATGNKYNNEKVFMNKIIELVKNYKSQN